MKDSKFGGVSRRWLAVIHHFTRRVDFIGKLNGQASSGLEIMFLCRISVLATNVDTVNSTVSSPL